MPQIQVILDALRVNEYLTDHKLTSGWREIEAILLQHAGMASGQPAAMLVIEIDGKKAVVKTSLRILETACRAMRAASGIGPDE
jgi:hypothetical protein